MTITCFADFYADRGHPVDVAPWRLALVTVMQYIEGLTDRQTADAVRRCMDWKYALSLELTDPGFDFTLLHDFRQRLLTPRRRSALARHALGHVQSARAGSRREANNERIPPMWWPPSVVCTTSNVCRKRCIMPSTSSARPRRSGCKSGHRWTWYDRYGPACRAVSIAQRDK